MGRSAEVLEEEGAVGGVGWMRLRQCHEVTGRVVFV